MVSAMQTKLQAQEGPCGELSPPLRTLIADDSSIFLTSLKRLLQLQGTIQVVGTAADGREALEKARQLIPDLVLLDLHMPVMDGFQTASLLRQQVPHSRIIIMTVDEVASLATACLTHGAHGFITKSKVITTLMAEIQHVCTAALPREDRRNP
jgi:two-component system nitrate/nitrite response regulator NarL